MASSLPPSQDYELDFFTAPTSVSPLSIEGSFDSLISATACLSQLKGQLGRWDGVSLLLYSIPITVFRNDRSKPTQVRFMSQSANVMRGSLLTSSTVRRGMLLGTSTRPGSSRINILTRTRYSRSTPLVRLDTRFRRWYPNNLTPLGASIETRRPLSQPLILEFMRSSFLRSIST